MPRLARHLATFYLGYFGLLGVLLPYLSLYLLDIGLSPYRIGVVLAVTPLVKTFAPNLWGWLADRTGSRRAFMRMAGLGALGCFSMMLGVRGFWPIVAVMAIYAVFTSSLLPLVEATAMEAVERLGVDYGRMRLWGSVGFIAASLGMGRILDLAPSTAVLWAILAFLVFNLWSVFHLPDGHPAPRPEGGGTRALLRSRPVLAFYGVCLLMQASHGTYYGFYSVYLEGLGFTRTQIGLLWALGVAAEVAAMIFTGRMLSALGTKRLMILALALTVIRWGILAATAAIPWLIAAQLLHAASFGLFHVSAVTHTHRLMPPALRATGQGLYSSLSFGLGLTVATYLAGALYSSIGAPMLFAGSAAVAAVAGGLALTLAAPREARAETA